MNKKVYPKKLSPVIVDENLLEQIPYSADTLLISDYYDDFDHFINDEFNYHWHDDFELGIVLKGELEYTIHQPNNKSLPQILKEGDGVFVNTQALHTAKQIKQGSIMYGITFPSTFFAGFPTSLIHQKIFYHCSALLLPGSF